MLFDPPSPQPRPSTPSAPPTLDALCAQVSQWTAAPTAERLDGLLANPALDAPAAAAAHFLPDRRCRRVLARGPAAELVLIGWEPGQLAPLHGHGDSACHLRVVQGRVHEHRVSAGEPRPTVHRAEAGARVAIPHGTWHDLHNPGPDRLVTLHLYAPPLDTRSARPTVAIVGGGASAVALSCALACQNVSVVVVDPSPAAGRGAGYTAHPACRLNVPAGAMSIHPRAPGHFLDWAAARGEPLDPAAFATRAQYGDYLSETLASLPNVRTVMGRVRRLRDGPGGWTLALDDGLTLVVDAVALATGHRPPARPSPLRALGPHPAVLDEPWRPGRLAGIAPNDSVFVLGTGLTFLDVLAVLDAQGHTGPVHALSRHGGVPLRHAQPAAPWAGSLPLTADPVTLLRALRAAARAEQAAGRAWHPVIDALRPHAAAIWSRWSDAERASFLRHAFPQWNIHRHRAPAEAIARVDSAQSDGRLHILRGWLTAVSPRSDGLALQWRSRNRTASPPPVTARWCILATGPGPADPTADPFLADLFAQGIASPDASALGFLTDPEGRVLAADGRPQPTLVAIGPVRRGGGPETTAIREIREQACAFADTLTHSLRTG
jgi:uncharacterized NAD(P)/FAD-binding protein YdhS/mannose-6-phosphate isomerase-like protein (cupin superfamily)